MAAAPTKKEEASAVFARAHPSLTALEAAAGVKGGTVTSNAKFTAAGYPNDSTSVELLYDEHDLLAFLKEKDVNESDRKRIVRIINKDKASVNEQAAREAEDGKGYRQVRSGEGGASFSANASSALAAHSRAKGPTKEERTADKKEKEKLRAERRRKKDEEAERKANMRKLKVYHFFRGVGGDVIKDKQFMTMNFHKDTFSKEDKRRGRRGREDRRRGWGQRGPRFQRGDLRPGRPRQVDHRRVHGHGAVWSLRRGARPPGLRHGRGQRQPRQERGSVRHHGEHVGGRGRHDHGEAVCGGGCSAW